MKSNRISDSFFFQKSMNVYILALAHTIVQILKDHTDVHVTKIIRISVATV